jgi:hypothetical protein
MKRWSKALGIALPLAMLAACKDQPVAPRSDTRTFTGAKANDFTNNPDVNLRIWRGQSDFAIGWSDPTNGLRAAHWTYDAGPGCGTTPEGGFMDAQIVINSRDTIARLIGNYKGRVWIRVRDMNQPGDCFGNKLVASGWGTLHYTDTDMLAETPTGHNSPDAWGVMAEGSLTTPDGAKVQYSGHVRQVWDDNAQIVVAQNAQVVLH